MKQTTFLLTITLTLTFLITQTTQRIQQSSKIPKSHLFFKKNNDPNPITNFEVEKYSGKWHEQARTENPFEKKKASNITAEYTLQKNGTILVENCSDFENTTKCGTGDASFVGEKNVADLIVNFGKNPFTRLFMKGSYRVVKTDYKNFAFLYTRQKFFFFYNKVFGWILTREKFLDQDVLEEYVQDFLSMSDLTREDLIFPENN